MSRDVIAAERKETPCLLCNHSQQSGRRGSNPRHLPWKGRTLPLSYSRSRLLDVIRRSFHRVKHFYGFRTLFGAGLAQTPALAVPDVPVRLQSLTLADAAYHGFTTVPAGTHQRPSGVTMNFCTFDGNSTVLAPSNVLHPTKRTTTPFTIPTA